MHIFNHRKGLIMAQAYYIKKNGKFLAKPKPIFDEVECDAYSDIDANSNVQFEWTDDEDRAKTYSDMRTAKTFIAKKRGVFWMGAEVIMK